MKFEAFVKDVKSEAHHVVNDVETSSLWKTAYEYHVPEAIVGVGALAAATAIAFTHSQELVRLLTNAPRVLLIEDTPAMAKALRVGLNEQGLRVSWFRGANGNPLWGKKSIGSLPLSPQKYQFAVVDGDLGPNSLTGDKVVAGLRSQNPNIFIVGSSSVKDMNKDIRANGADIAANKALLIGVLSCKQLQLAEALRQRESPGVAPLAQGQLDRINNDHSLPEFKEAYESGKASIKKYLMGK